MWFESYILRPASGSPSTARQSTMRQRESPSRMASASASIRVSYGISRVTRVATQGELMEVILTAVSEAEAGDRMRRTLKGSPKPSGPDSVGPHGQTGDVPRRYLGRIGIDDRRVHARVDAHHDRLGHRLSASIFGAPFTGTEWRAQAFLPVLAVADHGHAH